MIPRGAAKLLEMRTSGRKPSGDVWVNVGEYIDPFWWQYSNTLGHVEILIKPGDPVERVDFRCIAGLCVILFFDAWDDRIGRVYERLQEYAKEIAVMSGSFEDDIGWRWIKGFGRVELGEAHYIEDLEGAKASATDAARRDDKVAYQSAQTNEKRIREAAPWLR